MEPLAIGVHAVLGSFPGSTDRVLVVGSGPIALGTVWALRSLGFEGHVVVQALRFASPRGRVVLLGCAGSVSGLDLTFVWARELDVVGSVGYGEEEWEEERLHTFEITTRLLAEGRYPVEGLVTDVHPPEEYRDALASARNHARSGAIKVVLRP